MKLNPSLALTVLAVVLSASIIRAADAPNPPEKKDDAKSGASKESAKPFTLPDTVAVVEGTEIKKSELEEAFSAVLDQAGKKADDLTDDQKQQGIRSILDDLIIDKLLTKRSEKVTLDDTEITDNFSKFKAQFPSEEKMNEEIKQSGQSLDKVKENIVTALRQKKWIDSQISGKDTIAEQDAQAFYDKHPELFKTPDMVRASHILVLVPEDAKPEQVAEKEKKAKELAARVKKGEDFAKVAKEASEDPGSKDNGGDLDFFPRDRMVPEFADAAFKMKKGDISDPVKSQFGFHIIKVTDTKEARTVPFPEAKEKILAYLKDKKHRAAAQELIASIREKADIKVNLPEPAKSPEPEKK